MRRYASLVHSWGSAGEVKDSNLKEPQIAAVLYLLVEMRCLFFSLCHGNVGGRPRQHYTAMVPFTPASALAGRLERVDGIEPTIPLWKRGVLPLNYTRGAASAASGGGREGVKPVLERPTRPTPRKFFTGLDWK
jgi:hypothetical protein